MSLQLDDTTEVRRRPGSICFVRPAGDRVTVLLGDRLVRMPAWLGPAMTWIAETDRFAIGDLTEHVPDAESRLVLVRRLVREGLLTAVPGGVPEAGPR
jgi:hypothetical protein